MVLHRYSLLEVGVDDIHRDIELDGVAEENSESHHDLDQVGEAEMRRVDDGYLMIILDLQVFTWKVESDGAQDILSVLEVSKEPDSDVETGDHGHGCVEDSVPAPHVGWGLHLVLKRQHHAYTFEGIDSSSEVERELGDA